jgi:hypothetical protein
MKTGDIVYLEPINNAARRGNKELLERVVKTVGQKYIHVWDGQREFSITKFHKDGLRQVTDYASDWRLWLSKQDYLDNVEHGTLSSKIRGKFDTYGRVKLTLAQLRAINDIIEGDSR